MTDIFDDFDWDAFEKKDSFQMSEKQNEGTVDDIEHTVVFGTVISITQREVVVNIGYRTDGIIQKSEFIYNPELKVGDVVDVYIESKSNHLGQLILSHKKARAAKAWERVNEALDNNETVKAYVKCRTKGGTIVDVFGMEAFMPGSQTDIVRVDNLETFVGQTIGVKVVKINKEYRNVVVSRKSVVEENLAKKTTDKTLLKEIWQKHTEVQEQILRQRIAPVAIIPEATTIINEKLHVRVDTTDNTKEIQQQIADSLDIEYDECHFESGYVLAPISNWQKLDESVKARISTKANKEYVTFTYNPIVDGSVVDRRAQFTGVKQLLDKLEVEYDYDKNNRLQISIEELNRLKENEEFNGLQLALPDRASAIIPTYPSIIVYLEKLCPGLKLNNIETFKNNKREINTGVNIDKQVSVEGGYFTQEFLDQIKPTFELQMCKVEFTFIIHEDALNSYNWKVNKLGLPKLNGNTITFYKNVKRPKLQEDVERGIYDVVNVEDKSDDASDITYMTYSEFFNTRDTIDFYLWYKLMKKLFGKDNCDYTEKYYYKYRENRDWATVEELDKFNDDLHILFKPSIEHSVSSKGTSIGIDFNWKEKSLPELLTELNRDYPFVDFGLFKNGHKCNFDVQYKKADMTEVMNQLHDFSDDLHLELKKKGTELVFSREFQKIEDMLTFKTLLIHKLQTFDQSRYLCTISEVPSDKVKLVYFNDITSRDEDRLDAARELKGADFTVGKLKIGKLIRTANYPELVLDISGDFYEVTKQLFEETDVTEMTPDLSGDLEKLARLKESLNRIVEGRDVENSSLGTFIFDASQAAGIKDYEENIKLELQEVDKHLLNNRIANNEPQKVAIAKAILAPDLSLIQGPPGSGKSTAIAELIWQHVRENQNTRILLTSETNLAVDNAIDRIVNPYQNLVKPIRIGDESRLETEGLQFSYSAMYRWAKGENITAKKKSFDIDDDDDDDDVATTVEDSVYEAPEKLILLNWMENIGRRMDRDSMPEEAQNLWEDLLENPTDNLKGLFFDNYIANCNVVGATCSSIGQKNIIFTENIATQSNKNKFVPTAFYKTYRSVFSQRDNEYNPKIRFDVVIQDESSKATPAELSLPLIYGKKNIIIGDHRQLPPMISRESFTNSFDYLIKREKDNSELQRIKELKSFVVKNFNALEISHFERLYNQIDEKLKGVFNYQFRMHPAINEVIKQFYKDEGGLECGLVLPKDLGINDPDYINNGASRFHGITAGPIDPDVHVLWIDSSSPEMLDGTSRVNYGEVEIIRKLLRELNGSDSFHEYNNRWSSVEDKQIGLISFYGKQLRLLKEMVREFNPNEIPIRVSTVDRFQGMERNIIVVSMVRSHCIQTEKGQKPNYTKYGEDGYPKQEDLGFAQSPNRLNVALSRAKRLLVIVGDSQLFRTKEIYDNVYNTVFNHENGKILTAEEYGL
jgi:superfamily I DNA and/or RNA helicase